MIQAPSLILPRVWVTGLETELITDLVEHTSIEFPVEFLQEKIVHILAVEAVAAGVPGNLQVWVELSPLPSANSAYWAAPLPTAVAYWAAIGGGGGFSLPPVAPVVEVGTGVDGTIHTIIIPWVIHSGWARVVVQTPIPVVTAFWAIQILFSGKS